MARYKKFIIVENWKTNKVEIRIGYPIYHADLIDKSDEKEGWKCIGGGVWDVNFDVKEIRLYGDSSDFGKAPKKKIEEALKNMDAHKWWQFGWVCERIFEEEHPEVDYDHMENEYKFLIDY